MGEFSEREEAFFRSGERVETLPAAEEPRATWWRRLFRPELRGWSTLPFSRLAGRMLAAAVASGFGRGGDEGSVLGGFGMGS